MKNQKPGLDFGRSGELNTIIGKGTSFEGNLEVQNSLRIDGRIAGNLKSTDTVVVGKEGVVEGQIRAKHVLLAGKVQGNISSTGRVFLEATSTVLGDIKAAKLVVDEGAIFDGKCKMKDGDETFRCGGPVILELLTIQMKYQAGQPDGFKVGYGLFDS